MHSVWIQNSRKIGVSYLFILYVGFFSLISCEHSHDSAKDKASTVPLSQYSQAAPDHGGKTSKETTNTSARAKYIKELIDKYKEWGGHSPIPQRVVNANTFAKVRQEIGLKDSPALMILLQDDAEEIRSMAAILLDCVDPNAENKIEKQLSKESNVDRKDRLQDALLQIRVIDTSCK